MKVFLATLITACIFAACNKPDNIPRRSLSEYEAIPFRSIMKAGFYDLEMKGNQLILISESKFELELIDKDFNHSKLFGVKGFGPGEFRKISEIDLTDNRVFVYDSEKKSFEIFDREMNYLSSFTPGVNVLSFTTTNDSTIYVLGFDMNQWSVIEYSSPDFESTKYLHVESSIDPTEGVAKLSSSDHNILVSRLMTNKFMLLNAETGRKTSIRNNFINPTPEFVNAGQFKVPKAALWRNGLLTESHIYQIVNQDEKTLLYKYTLDGNLVEILEIDQTVSKILWDSDYAWVFVEKELRKYPKTHF